MEVTNMAKRIAVASIRELAKQEGAKDSKIIEVNGLEIEIKNYLSIQEKKELALLVNGNSFLGEGDLKLYDKTIEDVMLCYLIVREYTNINLMKDEFEFYDCMKASGLLDIILGHIAESELDYIKELIESRKQDDYRIMKLRGMLGHKFEGLLDILISKIDDVADTVKNFDPEKLTTLLDFMPKDKQKEMLNKKNNKVDRNELQKEIDAKIEKKIKAAEEKVSEFKVVKGNKDPKVEKKEKVEETDDTEGSTLNDNDDA